MSEEFNQVADYFNVLSRRYDLPSVFNDFLTMAVCSYHRTNLQSGLKQKDPDNEKLYMSIAKRYDGQELKTFSQILAQVQLSVYKAPYSDLLGEFFMQNITRGRNGQYFTPEPICEMMAISSGAQGTENKTVHDPACGSGRMLLAFAKVSHKNHFFGADNSDTCAKMATVNFFLNGLQGEVACMNTLSMEWYGGWQTNTRGIGIVPIEKEQSKIWTPAPQKKVEPIGSPSSSLKIGDATQLDLFGG